MTLTPREISHILSHLEDGEGRIRPGGWSALEKIDLIEKLKRFAAMEDEE